LQQLTKSPRRQLLDLSKHGFDRFFAKNLGGTVRHGEGGDDCAVFQRRSRQLPQSLEDSRKSSRLRCCKARVMGIPCPPYGRSARNK
jgi:hypothetical protein